MKVMQKL